ncbi:hypothetical protein BWQ96_07694 [Gracilariopsis chorda]|uniref:Uncharacterized protein n=1 Tax=Gracilariopsis chorda TaxID=448386 RepID=A0A2V3IKM5_9FLOR|nr:hypothetical protein BWQ96_07694 [Gracilariopsis chorda]|eukprot:PXF42599.1 hypothetical protein BWQ96_07694 [Gracilariopsis chorda]
MVSFALSSVRPEVSDLDHLIRAGNPLASGDPRVPVRFTHLPVERALAHSNQARLHHVLEDWALLDLARLPDLAGLLGNIRALLPGLLPTAALAKGIVRGAVELRVGDDIVGYNIPGARVPVVLISRPSADVENSKAAGAHLHIDLAVADVNALVGYLKYHSGR